MFKTNLSCPLHVTCEQSLLNNHPWTVTSEQSQITTLEQLRLISHVWSVTNGTPDQSRLIGYSWSVTPDQSPLISHAWSITPDQSRQNIYAWSVTPDQLRLISHKKMRLISHLDGCPMLQERWSGARIYAEPGMADQEYADQQYRFWLIRRHFYADQADFRHLGLD